MVVAVACSSQYRTDGPNSQALQTATQTNRTDAASSTPEPLPLVAPLQTNLDRLRPPEVQESFRGVITPAFDDGQKQWFLASQLDAVWQAGHDELAPTLPPGKTFKARQDQPQASEDPNVPVKLFEAYAPAQPFRPEWRCLWLDELFEAESVGNTARTAVAKERLAQLQDAYDNFMWHDGQPVDIAKQAAKDGAISELAWEHDNLCDLG
jgi:hypothetical protein